MDLETRELANGEVWELRGHRWHMIAPDEDYTPVDAGSFKYYADVIAAQQAEREAAAWREFRAEVRAWERERKAARS